MFFSPLAITKSIIFSMASMIIVLTFGSTWDTVLSSTYNQIVHWFTLMIKFQHIGRIYWWLNIILLKYWNKGHNKGDTIQCIYIETSYSSNKAPSLHFFTGYLVCGLDSRRTWYTQIYPPILAWHLSHQAYLRSNIILGHQILKHTDLNMRPPPKWPLSP